MNHNRYFRIDGNVDGLALPLRLGVNGIKHKMKEEGLFRFVYSCFNTISQGEGSLYPLMAMIKLGKGLFTDLAQATK